MVAKQPRPPLSSQYRRRLRIIGGKWRSRQIEISPDAPATLRPTPDRIRETLFNWLSPYIPNAVCLDLFAGTGILGFEALSRGAKHVIVVDIDRLLLNKIAVIAETLQASNQMTLVCSDVMRQLPICEHRVDIVFIDPPYYQGWVPLCLTRLLGVDWIHDRTVFYVEMEKAAFESQVIPPPLTWRKVKMTKTICYGLLGFHRNSSQHGQ